MVTRKDAEKALEGVNGTTIIGENGKEDQGRVAAVDWALSKDKWKEAEAKGSDAVEVEEETKEKTTEESAEKTANEDQPEGLAIGDSGEMMVPAGEEEEETKEEEEAVKPALPAPEEGSTLFIRNLSFEATEDQLRTL